MKLRLHNTLSGKVETVRPLEPGGFRFYVCGVTVYDLCHLGHARSALVFDVLHRYLRRAGLQVRFARNFTDIDDKIIARATRDGRDWREVAQTYIDAYQEDMGRRLGIAPATIEPRATEFIPRMIEIVRVLVEKGHAYPAGGDVFYAVDSFPGYGKLSHRRPEELRAGARVEVDERKRHPLDFVLWKASKPGEPSWDSPWGPGRPGWHIECSAMAIALLGETLDLHGGGQDLIFPHHENEIAQSETYTGKEFSRMWVHNGFVTVNREKMSKSLGNFFTVREIFEQVERQWGWTEAVTRETLRYLLLGVHYRAPLDFSDQELQAAHAGLTRLYTLLKVLKEREGAQNRSPKFLRAILDQGSSAFEVALHDDLNTPRALAALQGLASDLNRNLDALTPSAAAAAIQRLTGLGEALGLLQVSPEDWKFQTSVVSDAVVPVAWGASISEAEINLLVAAREEARKRRDWTEADRIRGELARRGVILEDRPDGSTRIKR